MVLRTGISLRARLAAAALLGATVAATALAAPALADPAGNNGTIKVAEVGEVGTESNDPHVACTFALEWYGFDAAAVSTVGFESIAPTGDAALTVASGAQVVTLEDDAAKGGTDLDGREIYTLSFVGAPQQNQGYHVNVTTNTTGSQGNDSKSKNFWVGPCAPVDPVDPVDPVEPADPCDPVDAVDPVPAVVTDPGHPTNPVVPWDWNWEYDAPAHDALTVDYPSNIPDGQANDVNVRFQTEHGQFTLNFHNNDGTWAGHTVFTFASHPSWPVGLTSYDVVWVQVGGTNYHWQGHTTCPADAGSGTSYEPGTGTATDPFETELSGFRSGSLVVSRGSGVPADTVAIEQAGDAPLTLETYVGGTWQVAKIVATSDSGLARVTFPRLSKRGTYKFRLTLSQTISTTGDATGILTVRVR